MWEASPTPISLGDTVLDLGEASHNGFSAELNKF
jgi:hypothetical protein